MYIVNKDRQHHKVQHKHHQFATGAAATTLVTALGTGFAIVPIYWRLSASALGTVLLENGSGGASIMRTSALVNHEEQASPWWGLTEVSAATAIEITKATGIGAGEFDLWYIIVRMGAGDGGNTQ